MRPCERNNANVVNGYIEKGYAQKILHESAMDVPKMVPTTSWSCKSKETRETPCSV